MYTISGSKMEDVMRNFTRSEVAEGNAHPERSVPKRKFRQASLDSGIADEEEGAVRVNFNLDWDYDMSEDEDDDEDLLDEEL